jgi:hypothetical protein
MSTEQAPLTAEQEYVHLVTPLEMAVQTALDVEELNEYFTDTEDWRQTFLRETAKAAMWAQIATAAAANGYAGWCNHDLLPKPIEREEAEDSVSDTAEEG